MELLTGMSRHLLPQTQTHELTHTHNLTTDLADEFIEAAGMELLPDKVCAVHATQ